MDYQQPLPSLGIPVKTKRESRVGTYSDNMILPIHRWFRYSAGFSSEWVERVLKDWGVGKNENVLDPFVGSGTALLACDKNEINSIGIEAHSTVARICEAKLKWDSPVENFLQKSVQITNGAISHNHIENKYPDLILRSYSSETLLILDGLRESWNINNDFSAASELIWLAITSILRSCSTAGTAQWQYILPNKTKKRVSDPLTAINNQIKMMAEDMVWMQNLGVDNKSRLIKGDARLCGGSVNQVIDAVITSPPYANNFDYADALRFEMTFWGEVNSWGDLHEKVRKNLIVSSSQHSSKEGLTADEILASLELLPIRKELSEIVHQLSITRENHGGKKNYHTMIASYCRDIAQTMNGLRKICKNNVHMCWVIGDSAPYGVYCPIDRWIGELAIANGFKSYEFEKLRDRNIKWKNRKHQVPLKEGLLWIEG